MLRAKFNFFETISGCEKIHANVLPNIYLKQDGTRSEIGWWWGVQNKDFGPEH